MSASVWLFTDRFSFEAAWRPVLERLQVGVVVARPETLPDLLRPDSALVVDAGSSYYDEDELLAHVGLARAFGALPAVGLPGTHSLPLAEDLVEDLCAGLVARSPEDVSRVSSALVRRLSARLTPRFEYLTVSPRGNELLVILSDGTALLLPRPLHHSDDKSEIASIALSEDARGATLELASTRKLELSVEDVLLRNERGSNHGTMHSTSNGDALAAIDGQRLGARIRALRRAAGLTQAELARRTGIHRPNIARVEAGRHTPSLETLARLAAALGVPTTRVLTDD
jgi:DNA-binding XRE family transcriptional regulator